MKIFKIIMLCAVTLLIVCIISIPLINNYQAYKVKRQLLSMPLPEKSEIVESISKAGKLTGNGNGMQYLGVILIQSDLSTEELKEHYKKYSQGEMNGPFVKEQTSQSVDITNSPIKLSTTLESQRYYIVYLWDYNNLGFLDFDLRGH